MGAQTNQRAGASRSATSLHHRQLSFSIRDTRPSPLVPRLPSATNRRYSALQEIASRPIRTGFSQLKCLEYRPRTATSPCSFRCRSRASRCALRLFRLCLESLWHLPFVVRPDKSPSPFQNRFAIHPRLASKPASGFVWSTRTSPRRADNIHAASCSTMAAFRVRRFRRNSEDETQPDRRRSDARVRRLRTPAHKRRELRRVHASDTAWSNSI